MSGLDRCVTVTVDIEGLHHWADAPVSEDYLRHPHRHQFAVTVRMQVHHGDREVEINAFARWLRREALPALAIDALAGGALDFGPQSCEHLAERLITAIQDRYGRGRWIDCEFLEDGILGGGVRWQP